MTCPEHFGIPGQPPGHKTMEQLEHELFSVDFILECQIAKVLTEAMAWSDDED